MLRIALVVTATTVALNAQDPCMMRGIGWRTDAVFTIGNAAPNGFIPAGIPDGMFAYPTSNSNEAIVYVTAELNANTGYPYTLANGTVLTGARVTAFRITRDADGSGRVLAARNAYDTIVDRVGAIVTDPIQVNETGSGINGFGRFCSANGVLAGTYGFVDDIFLTGEENGNGSFWAIDVDTDTIYGCPQLGRGSWESATPVDTGDPQTIGLILGDDVGPAPCYLYVGVKNAIGDSSFLDRNGLAQGTLHYWKADNGDTTPAQFSTRGSRRTGAWSPIVVQDPARAGQSGYDALGFKNASTLRSEAFAAGGFQFSRPEDIATNPADANRVVFASTGRSSLFGGADTWGTVYLFDVTFTAGSAPTSTFYVTADSDNEPVPDDGIRSPDNLTWATNGKVYIQEDRSTGLFGGTSGREASIWELDPATDAIVRVGEMNRYVVLPSGVTDGDPNDLGDWESSGVIDVTALFDTAPGETLLFGNVQAHSVRDGIIANQDLVQGGQLFFMSNASIDHAIDARNTIDFYVTGGTPGNGYAVVLAFANAGTAPNGYFYGVSPTFAEFSFVQPPFLGLLDSEGNADFQINITATLGLTVDTVAIELDANGIPVGRGPAVSVRL